jgi:Xaa-Pro aminopeptidase
MCKELERIPEEEIQWRWKRCRKILSELLPQAEGLLVFSRLNIYYLTGHWAAGAFWLPIQGEPVLMIRKGIERARLEASVENIHNFKSHRDIPLVLQKQGLKAPQKAAVEMSGLSWEMGEGLRQKIPDWEFVPGDLALKKARMVKSEWELQKIRIAGERHDQCLQRDLPQYIRPGMTEREISVLNWQVYFARGHQGQMRMGAPGEEIFLGHVAAGDSGNYPSVFNGPVGLRGEHPATPFMGYAGKVWQKGQPLTLDTGFVLEGYHTDKTQVYWAGRKEDIPEQVLAAHQFCIKVQTEAARMLYAGQKPSELFRISQQMAEEEGWSEGFMGLNGNKVPFLGHGIGLTIDEWPVLASKFEEPLQKNMVIALEPKIGLPELGMVGVENTFLVAEDGGECLTGNSYELICIE